MKYGRLIAAICLLALALSATAEETPFPGLSRFTLDNGLELFVLENHQTPLVYIEIAFRAGAYAQTPETAGLFHLYEHMMFKGNSKYRSAAEVQKAYLDLGVSSWNGSTGAEKVNYFFTVPSDKAREGLDFWSMAVREPLLDAKELESEIGVVSSEIAGDIADPKAIAQAAADKAVFPRFPWRRDPGGSLEVIRACTVEKLRAMKDAYYIPNNAALFVGGDITAEEALAMVQEAYGGWKRGPDPWAAEQEPQAADATDKARYLVYPDPNLSQAYGIASVYLRGPDVDTDPTPTFAADVFGYLLANPDGPFKQSIFGISDLGIPDPNYLAGYYYTQRDGGQIVFMAYMLSKSVLSFAQRGKMFSDAILGTEIPRIVSDAAFYSPEDYELVKNIMEDGQIMELETVDGFLSTLSFWWASASTDYFFNYVPSMKKVGHAEIADYLSAYMAGKAPIVFLRINPAVWEKQKDFFAKLGYEVVTAENAFWWKE